MRDKRHSTLFKIMSYIITVICTPSHNIKRSINLSNIKFTVAIKILFVTDINLRWYLKPIAIDKEIDVRKIVSTSTSGQSILKRHFIVSYSNVFMKLSYKIVIPNTWEVDIRRCCVPNRIQTKVILQKTCSFIIFELKGLRITFSNSNSISL